jgi:Gas vesicle synthesis protein GvpL/GvpF
VGGAAVESVDVNGLRCFYSLVDAVASDGESLKRGALEFHGVTQSLFEQTAIIPFRFPTVLASVAEVDAHLRERAPAYDAALKQFRDMVQMEVRFGLTEAQAAEAGSGTEYLKSRAQRGFQLQQAISACRVAIDEEVIDWRQRESSLGVRCFVLVKREAVQKVQKQLEQLRLERAVTAAVSGPWPPTEFLQDFG